MTISPAVMNATNLGCSLTCRDVGASISWYRDAVGGVPTSNFTRGLSILFR